jgi:hypothetical protein
MRSEAASNSLVARPVRARPHIGSSPIVAIAIATLLTGGCATNQNYAQPRGVTQHAAVPAPIPRPKVEIEDDGRPVQSPPARLMRPEEDDPTQPWSPNYGKSHGALPRTADAKTAPPRPVIAPGPEPRDVHPATARALTEDEIVARAISQHEMAQQARRR